jgi:hypothetical protein
MTSLQRFQRRYRFADPEIGELPWGWRALQGPRGPPGRDRDAGEFFDTPTGTPCATWERVVWTSPRPPWPFTGCPAGLRGPRSREASVARCPRPPGLHPTFGAPAPRRSSRDARTRRARPASPGIRVRPSTDMSPLRPLPPALPPASASGLQTLDSFRPRGFAPPRRFPPQRSVRACCIPLPVLGFVAFRASVAAARPKPATVYGKRFPRRGSYPPKNPPRRQPYRVTTALAFLPLPTRRPTGAPVHRSGPPHRPFRPCVAHCCVSQAPPGSRLQGLAPPTSP